MSVQYVLIGTQDASQDNLRTIRKRLHGRRLKPGVIVVDGQSDHPLLLKIGFVRSPQLAVLNNGNVERRIYGVENILKEITHET